MRQDRKGWIACHFGFSVPSLTRFTPIPLENGGVDWLEHHLLPLNTGQNHWHPLAWDLQHRQLLLREGIATTPLESDEKERVDSKRIIWLQTWGNFSSSLSLLSSSFTSLYRFNTDQQETKGKGPCSYIPFLFKFLLVLELIGTGRVLLGSWIHIHLTRCLSSSLN